MKKIIIGSILIVGLTTGFAFAHGKGYGGRGNGYSMGGGGYHMMDSGSNGPGMMGYQRGGGGWENNDCRCAYGAGQGGWNNDERQKFLEETLELRKQMNDKRFEFREARRTGNVDRDKLAQLQKDMIDIRTQIQKKAEELSGKTN